MPRAITLLKINFAGLGILLLASLSMFFTLFSQDINPVIIVGFFFCVFAILFFTALLLWNLAIYQAIRRDEYSGNPFRNSMIIFFAGIAIPLLLILADLILVANATA